MFTVLTSVGQAKALVPSPHLAHTSYFFWLAKAFDKDQMLSVWSSLDDEMAICIDRIVRYYELPRLRFDACSYHAQFHQFTVAAFFAPSLKKVEIIGKQNASVLIMLLRACLQSNACKVTDLTLSGFDVFTPEVTKIFLRGVAYRFERIQVGKQVFEGKEGIDNLLKVIRDRSKSTQALSVELPLSSSQSPASTVSSGDPSPTSSGSQTPTSFTLKASPSLKD